MTIAPPQRNWIPPAQLFVWNSAVVHHTAAEDDHETMQADDVTDYHVRVRRWKDAGYNFVFEMIEHTPVAIFLRPLTTNGAHTLGWNRLAVGLVFAGNFDETEPPEELIIMAVEDVFKPIIVGLLHITKDHIYRHDQVGQTRCPGSKFRIESILDRL